MEKTCSFGYALQIMDEAHSFLSKELTSSLVTDILEEHHKEIELFEDGHYFELIGIIHNELEDIQCICAKTYADNGVCFIMIYFEGSFYTIISGITEDEPLLDIQFPDVSQEGDGIVLGIYDDDMDDSSKVNWRKLSLWQSSLVFDESVSDSSTLSNTLDLPSDHYVQTYCVLKPNKLDQSDRDVLFRFGSWCYSGNVELIDSLKIEDICYVIPALRVQQHKLSFLCDVSEMPEDSLFSEPMIHNNNIISLLENEIISSESAISNMKNSFLDENPRNLFFEFSSNGTIPTFIKNHIDLIATKSYRPNGLIVMTIYFNGTFYVSVNDGDGDQPLLDSEFPSVVQGKGYQLKTYPDGVALFPQLRKLTIWQNAEAAEEDDSFNSAIRKKTEIVCAGESGTDGATISGEISSSKEAIHEPSETCDNLSSQLSNIADCEAKDCYEHETAEDVKQIKFQRKHQAEKKTDIKEIPSDEYKDEDAKSINSKIGSNTNSRKWQNNLGAFHHLAPLRKQSTLADHIQKINIETRGQAPYDLQSGRPVF